MYLFELLSLCCIGLTIVFFVGFIYYLLVLKEKNRHRYKKFRRFFKEFSKSSNFNKKVKTNKPGINNSKTDKKTDVEDAEFREIKK